MTINDLAIMIIEASGFLTVSGLLLMMIFMLAKKDQLVRISGIVSAVSVTVLLCVVFFMEGNTPGENNQSLFGEKAEASEPVTADALIEIGYTAENAAEIWKILNSVGITDVELYGTVENDPNVGINSMSMYPNGHVEDKYRFTCTTEDGVVTYIGFLDETLYDPGNGGVQKAYGSVHVPETEVSLELKSALMHISEDAAKEIVSLPATVKFKILSWKFSREDDLCAVQSEFTCKNALGLKITHELRVVCKISEDGQSVKATEIYLNRNRVA